MTAADVHSGRVRRRRARKNDAEVTKGTRPEFAEKTVLKTKMRRAFLLMFCRVERERESEEKIDLSPEMGPKVKQVESIEVRFVLICLPEQGDTNTFLTGLRKS